LLIKNVKIKMENDLRYAEGFGKASNLKCKNNFKIQHSILSF